MACDDRQLTEAQRVAGYQNQRTGVQRAVRPFSGKPTVENLIDYINRELQPAVRQTRDAVNDVYLQVADNAPSGNPLGFYFSTETGAADPTAGRVRLNNATQDTATIIRVSESNGRLVNVAPWLDVMAGSVTSPLGVVTLTDAINPGRFIRFDLNTMTDQGVYWDLGVTPIESSHDNPFVDDGAIVVSFIPGVGSTPATIPPTAISGADGPRQFLATSTGTTVDWRTLSTIFPGAPIYDVMAYPFNAAGGLGGDDTAEINAAIAAANAAPGPIFLGPTHRITAALTPITNNNIWLIGRGNFNGGTILLVDTAAAVDGAIVLSGGRDCGVRDIWIACDNAYSTGWGVVLTGATRATLQDLLITAFANGVEVDRCNTTYLRRVRVGDVLGEYGVLIHGEAPSSFNHVVNLDNCLVGQDYPLTLGTGLGAWAPSTAYTVGQVVYANGGIWQNSTAGTSAGSGTGPSGLPSSNPSLVHVTPVTDGTAAWRFAMGKFVGFGHGSFAHTVIYDRCGVLQGDVGMRVFDDAGDAPTFIHAWQFAADHCLTTGVDLQACDGAVMFDQLLSTSVLTTAAAGVVIAAAATRWQFSGGEVNQGVTVAGSAGVIRGMHTSTIALASTADEILVEDNHLTGNITIASGADNYVVQGNFVNGSITNTPGRSDTRVVEGNIPDTEIAVGSVWGLQIDHGASDVPREVTKHELGENLRRSTHVVDSTSSGTSNTYAIANTTTQVNFKLAGALTINGMTATDAATFGKLVVFSFDSGFAGSVTWNNESGSAGSSLERVRTPGGVALTISAGETVTFEHFDSRWRCISPGKANAITDGDKGDVTVSSSGTVWTVDADISKNWTGSHTWVSTTWTVQATNDILIYTPSSGIHLGAGHSVANVGNGDIIANATGGVSLTAGLVTADDNVGTGEIELQADQLVRVFTGGVERLEIENDGAWQVGGASGTSGHPLVSAGASAPPAWGQLPTAGIADDAVTDAKLRESDALSVIGRSANSTGNPADIAAGTDGHVLRRSGTTLGFGTVATAGIADAAVTLAKMANLAQSSIIGRAESAGTGVPTALTSTQVVAIIDGEPITWLNDHVFTDNTRFESTFRLGGILTTATTAANDLAIGAVNVVRFTGPPNPLTGMVADATSQVVLLVNAHETDDMVISLESPSSAAANTFAGEVTDRHIKPDEMALAWYDGTSSRWRLLCRDDVDL